MIMYISKFKFLTLLIVLLTIGTFSVSEEISEKDSEIHKVGGGILGRLKELLTEFFEEDVT